MAGIQNTINSALGSAAQLSLLARGVQKLDATAQATEKTTQIMQAKSSAEKNKEALITKYGQKKYNQMVKLGEYEASGQPYGYDYDGNPVPLSVQEQAANIADQNSQQAVQAKKTQKANLQERMKQVTVNGQNMDLSKFSPDAQEQIRKALGGNY